MIISPAEYYAAHKHESRFVREVKGPFEDGISDGQRKRIEKCRRLGFSFGLTNLYTAYPIIADNRARKGRPYSMTEADWREMERLYGANYFAVTGTPGFVAAALCVMVSPDILYVQAWGDIAGQEANSPITFLCRGIYGWCALSNVRCLDIGIAGDNEGLRNFKQRLGFDEVMDCAAIA